MNLIGFNAWRKFWALIHAYWWSDEKASARLLLFAIVALTRVRWVKHSTRTENH